MLSLIAAIAVHPVRIDHEVEYLPLLLKGIHKKQGVLEMHIVIPCSVSEFKHNGLDIWGAAVF